MSDPLPISTSSNRGQETSLRLARETANKLEALRDVLVARAKRRPHQAPPYLLTRHPGLEAAILWLLSLRWKNVERARRYRATRGKALDEPAAQE